MYTGSIVGLKACLKDLLKRAWHDFTHPSKKNAFRTYARVRINRREVAAYTGIGSLFYYHYNAPTVQLYLWECHVLILFEGPETCLAGRIIGRRRDHASVPAAAPCATPGLMPTACERCAPANRLVCLLQILATNGQNSLT